MHRGGETTRAREVVGTVCTPRRLAAETVIARLFAPYSRGRNVGRDPTAMRDGRHEAQLVWSIESTQGLA